MRKLGKVLAVLLSLTMILGMSGVTAFAQETYREPITITVFDELANYAGEQTGWFAKVIKDKFNITMNLISTNLDPNAYQTRMASGDLGDLVVFGDTGEHLVSAIKANMLLDWNELDYGQYEHIAKYTKDAIQKVSTFVKENAKVDGVWGFGHDIAYDKTGWDVSIEPNYGMQVRWDAYVKAGMPKLETIDDLVPFLKALQDAMPANELGEKVYAYGGFPDWEDCVMKFTWDMMTWYGYAEYDFMGVNWSNGQVVNPLEENSLYKQMLGINNKLYREGLFDPDSQGQTFDTYSQKVDAGRYLMGLWGWKMKAFNTPERVAKAEGFVTMGLANDAPVVNGTATYGGNRVWTIGANCKYPERVLELIDWLCSTEGIMTNFNGPQGLCWDYDANGKPFGTEFGWKAWNDKANTDVPAEYGGGKYQDGENAINNTTIMLNAIDPEGGFFYNHDVWEDGIKRLENPLLKDWSEKYAGGAKTGVEYLKQTGRFSLHPASQYAYADKGDDLNGKRAQFAPIMKEYSWKCVYATSDEEFESTWKEMVEKCKAFGYDEVVAFYQTEIANKLAAIAEGK